MPIVPVRDLGAVGVMLDVPPYDLPPNGWSKALNVRFDDKAVSRAPIYRRVTDLPSEALHVLPVRPIDAYDSMVVVGMDGRVREYANGTVTDVTDTAVTPVAGDVPTTSCTLGQVYYTNKSDMVPLHRTPAASTFSPLPNWDSTWRCKALRPFKDFLVALNVTKGATEHPYMVKWSDLTLAGQAPGSWDHTDATTSAGENVLTELRSPLIDAAPLRDDMVLYAQDQVWLMEYTGDNFVFAFRKAFAGMGIINTDCVVEVEGLHYVFGPDDIYVHDGTTPKSIAEGRVRKRIFEEINVSMADRCFVAHNENLNEVMFCYVSSLDEERFPGTTRCNKAAVFNTVSGTWTFYELPNVVSFGMINLDTVLTYDTVTASYEGMGGTYAEQSDGFRSQPVFAVTQGPLSAHRLLALDRYDGGEVAFPYEPEAETIPVLERVGVDMDELQLTLRGRKSVKAIYPQMALRAENDEATLGLSVGWHDYPSQSPRWAAPVNFNSTHNYKIDTRTHGRYIALSLEADATSDFNVSGYDIDVRRISRR